MSVEESETGECCIICANEFYSLKQHYKLGCINRCGFSCCAECFINNAKHSEKIDIACIGCKYVYSEYELKKLPLLSTFVGKTNKTRVAELVVSSVEHLMPLLEIKATKFAQAKAMDAEIKDINRQISLLRQEQNKLKYKVFELELSSKLLYEFDIFDNLKCPIGECGGYSGINNVCDTCGKKICHECNSENLANHICDADSLATAEYIKQNSIRCPKCRTSISKIAGCNQMYCVVCKAKFLYTTGQQIFQQIENPHIPVGTHMLSDCNPIDIPTQHMRWLSYHHPLDKLMNYLVGVYMNSTTDIAKMSEFLDETHQRKLLHNMIANYIATGRNKSALRGKISIVMNKREHYAKHLPYLEVLNTVSCELVWSLTENKEVMDGVIIRKVCEKAFELMNWWVEIVPQFYIYNSMKTLNNWHTAGLRKILDDIPKDINDGYITPPVEEIIT